MLYSQQYSVFLLLIVIGIVFSSHHGHIKLKTLDNLYLPARYIHGQPIYEYGAAAAEQFDVDVEEKIIYAVGSELIFVIDMDDVDDLEIITYRSVDGFEITDIELCGDFVFVTLDNLINNEEGKIIIFHKFDRKVNRLVEYTSFVVGALPDMIKPSHDCSKAVVALEGEPYAKDGLLVDPEGGVGIISYDSQNTANKFSYKLLDFKSFNPRVDDLVAAGVRKSNPTATLSQDLEPEYVAISDDDSKAYVALQENNAIAVVDLVNDRIDGIYPMGFKNWAASSLELSKADGGISMKPWPVFGLYQPDTIVYTTFNGVGYLVTANEGDEREYNEGVSNGYIDTISGQDLAKDLSKLDLPSEVIGFLQDDKALGQAHFSTVDGINPNTGKYDKLFTFGGRGFSIIMADTMQMVYDSGNLIESSIASYFPYIFNGDQDGDKSARDQRDDRSPSKGPETESVAVGELDGHLVIIAGHERPGAITFHKVTNDITNPVLTGIWTGIDDSSRTLGRLFNKRKLFAVDPEDLKFIPANKSPEDEPLLIVAGSESGTITVLEIKDDDDDRDEVDDRKRSTDEVEDKIASRTLRILMGKTI